MVKINYYLPAVAQGQEPVRLQAVDMAACGLSEPELATEKEHLRLALERWVAERRFTRPGRRQGTNCAGIGDDKRVSLLVFQE